MEHRYFDRDLSWLAFNQRILQEAADPNVPLYERIKFLAIYSSNLDEFFRVRVATIRGVIEIDKKKINKSFEEKPKKLLNQILNSVDLQLEEFGRVWRKELLPALAHQKIILYQNEAINPNHKAFVTAFFKSRVLSYLQPIRIGKDQHIFLENHALYLVVEAEVEEVKEAYLINIPSNELNRIITLPELDGFHYFILLDDVIRENLNFLFPGYRILGSYSIKLNRDADLNIEDEFEGNLIEKIQKQLAKRDLGVTSRFLYDQRISKALQALMTKVFGLKESDMVPGGNYHNFNDLFGLPNPNGSALQNEDLTPINKNSIEENQSIFNCIEEDDLVLHFPYHSYDYVLRFFNEAALNRNITEINATFYRVASNSFIINALISAARNGKKVTVFVEVKARFDEENNLKWAKKMEEAGVKIIYSMPGMKVHAKVALISGKKEDGSSIYYAYYGTGNFNEKTAAIYADTAVFTSNIKLNGDLKQVFEYLIHKKNTPKLDQLLVSPFNLKPELLQKIDREIQHALQGRSSHIIIKVNNLQEKGVIDKLYEASAAGVRIDLLVRGICCLVPQVENMSDKITVKRIVDRYLEHARIYYFYNDGNEEMYAGSADLMDRNLKRRVEVVFPVVNQARHELKTMLQLQWNDNVKATILDQDMQNIVVPSEKEPVRSQVDFYNWLKDKELS